MSKKKLFFKKIGKSSPLYDDSFAVYSLRDIFNWTNAVIKIQRDNDTVSTHVFFDNNGEISLNSLTSNSPTIPTATSLAAFIGSNSANIREWHKMTADNIFLSNDSLINFTPEAQPTFINSGNIKTKNGKNTIEYNGINQKLFKSVGSFSELNSGNTFTAITVSYNDNVNSLGAVINTSSTLNTRYTMVNDRRSNAVISIINGGLVGVQTNYLSQQDTNSQKILTNIVTSTDVTAYYGNVLQDLELWSGNYINDTLTVGAQFNSISFLNGGIQEIVLFPSDKTNNLSSIQDDINNYYNID